MLRRSLVAAAMLPTPALALAAGLQGLPGGPLGEAVQRGYEMITHTQTDPQVKAYVGNALNCASCHTDAGNNHNPGNFLLTATKFPGYSKRENTVLTLEDRIDNCFMRSMNGMRPNPDSPVTVDMAAYIAWLDRGKPLYGATPAKGASPYAPMLASASHADFIAGKKVYAANCAACHQASGGGIPGTFPPLWGKESYNAGAGLANVVKLATWVKGNMPLGNAHLSEKEAFEVALYVDTHPRPDFVLSQHLPAGIGPDGYNAKVRAETDTVEGNLRKVGLSVDALR